MLTRDGVAIYGADGSPVARAPRPVVLRRRRGWARAAFPHWTLKEIHEQPERLRDLVAVALRSRPRADAARRDRALRRGPGGDRARGPRRVRDGVLRGALRRPRDRGVRRASRPAWCPASEYDASPAVLGPTDARRRGEPVRRDGRRARARSTIGDERRRADDRRPQRAREPHREVGGGIRRHPRRPRGRRRLDEGLHGHAALAVRARDASSPRSGRGPRARSSGSCPRCARCPASVERVLERARRGAGRRARGAPRRAHALPRPRPRSRDRARGRAQDEGALLHPRRGLRRGRDEARPDRARLARRADGRDHRLRRAPHADARRACAR